jgi:hypothetical protein
MCLSVLYGAQESDNNLKGFAHRRKDGGVNLDRIPACIEALYRNHSFSFLNNIDLLFSISLFQAFRNG